MMPNIWLMIYLINFFMLIYMIILNYFNFKNKKL